MLKGIGIDIIENRRIAKSVSKLGERFLKKIYTPRELEYCMPKANRYQHLAARFAAKEAVAKALYEFWDEVISWQSIEIQNRENGKPVVVLKGPLEAIKHIESCIRISISHTHDYATCIAVIEEK